MNYICHHIANNQGEERVDKFLASQIENFSRSEIKQYLDAGMIFRGEEAITKKTKLYEGDVLQFPERKQSPKLYAQNIPLDIIFEDDHLIVLNKATGMVVHPGSNTGDDTLVHALLNHCGETLRSVGDVDRPGVVHRLDKETSGLIVFAKDSETHTKLQKSFANREIYKKYDCLVAGNMENSQGTVEAPIGRHPSVRVRMAVVEDGRYAKTDWFLVNNYNNYAHVKCRIHTGRTHQIRVHMKHLGHVLLGDSTYGFKGKKFSELPEISRVMLNASELKFKHPLTGKELSFQIDMPEDFQVLL